MRLVCKHSVWISKRTLGKPNPPYRAVNRRKENEEMFGFILGTMTGGAMGVFAMCLLISGKREDEALERCRMKPKEIIDHGVCICFVNSQGTGTVPAFRRGALCRMPQNGERNVSPAIIWMPILP